MNEFDPTDLTNYIIREDKELFVDSRVAANAFGKRHKNVLRTIEAMRSSTSQEIAEHAGTHFGPSAYVDSTGQQRPMYLMTAEGLSTLAMSFTGDKARVVHIRFINAFEEVVKLEADREKSITEQMHASRCTRSTGAKRLR